MNQTGRTATKTQEKLELSPIVPNSAVTEISGFKRLALRLDLQSMAALLTVLANVARLGCDLHHVAATNGTVHLIFSAPAHIAHRVESCLAQIIGVLAISVVTKTE